MIILIVAIGMTSSCTSRQNVTNDHKDSVEYAVYVSKIVDYPNDLDPCYIPMDLLGIHLEGDTLFVNGDGVLVPQLMYESETHKPVDNDVHKVILLNRIEHNKWLAK